MAGLKDQLMISDSPRAAISLVMNELAGRWNHDRLVLPAMRVVGRH